MADLNIGVGTRPTEFNLDLGVGTVMGVGVEYTAGEGIWIEDHVINADVTQEEVDSKANTNGYYTTLAAGAADALMGDPSESTWATRTSTGSGMARVESVQGATVGWNQLVPLLNDSAWVKSNNITVDIDAESNSVTLTSTSDSTGTKTFRLPNAFNPTVGHMFYVACEVETNAVYTATFGIYATNGTTAAGLSVAAGTPRGRFATIATATSIGYIGIRLNNSTASGYSATFKDFVVIDLTAMFGAGNEPATVAEFERMFPEAYYPYSTPTLKPVTIAGIRSTDAQGGELDSVEWETQTLRAAGSVRDELTAGELVTRVGVVVVDGVNVKAYNTSQASGHTHGLIDMGAGTMVNNTSQLLISCDKLPAMNSTQELTATLGICVGSDRFIRFVTPDIAEATSVADLNAWLQQNPLTCFYAIATPTTTPISPALPMSYRVEQGGTQSIVVPEGEVSAAPVLTVAEGESAADVVMGALAAIAAPDGPTATANHAVNTYLTMGGKLYKVTTAIASGEQIVSGTNVTETTVMDELLALAN